MAIEVTDKLCQKAYELARKGCTKKQIAAGLGMVEATLYRKEENERFNSAIKKGQAECIQEVENLLFQACQKNNVTALIFFLKCRGDWKEGQLEEAAKMIAEIIRRDQAAENRTKPSSL